MAAFTREHVTSVLDYWFGPIDTWDREPEASMARHQFWWQGGPEMDEYIATSEFRDMHEAVCRSPDPVVTAGQTRRELAEQGHYAGRTRPTNTRQGIYAAAPSGVLLASVNTRSAERMAAMLEEALAAGRSPFPRAEAFAVHDLIDPRRTRPALCDWLDWVQPLLREHVGVRRHAIRP